MEGRFHTANCQRFDCTASYTLCCVCLSCSQARSWVLATHVPSYWVTPGHVVHPRSHPPAPWLGVETALAQLQLLLKVVDGPRGHA